MWIAQVACLGRRETRVKCLPKKPEGIRPLESAVSRWRDKIKTNIKEIR
jgi:hypothetical protein